jgi:AcrR family transcriptional regulator
MSGSGQKSESVRKRGEPMNDKKDRRSERTRRLLSEAMVELIREKDYNSITVNDIIERANVGRSTFYAHYRDKDDLFMGELDRVINVLSHGILHTPQDESSLFPSLGLFRHIRDQYALYKALMWGPGIELLIMQIQKSLNEKIAENLEKSGKQFNVAIPVLANYITGSYLTLLKWWLDNKMTYSPEQMDEIFKQLTMPGIEQAVVK